MRAAVARDGHHLTHPALRGTITTRGHFAMKIPGELLAEINMQGIGQKKQYLGAIDGLRAVSILAVIINHFNADLLPSGYLGVDVFFVISGFVITLSLLDRPKSSLQSTLAEFYSQRFKRLVPALALSIVVGAFAIRLFDPDPIRSIYTAVFALFGGSNLFLYTQAIDYFGPTVELNPFMHTWSLAVEEQFYLVYPLILLLGAGQNRISTSGRAIIIALLSLASLLAFVLIYHRDQPAAYFLLPFRFWELGAGCLLAISCRNQLLGEINSRLTSIRGDLALLPLVAIFFLPESFPVLGTILACAMACAVVAFVWRGECGGGVLRNRFVQRIGILSYSLYLWHWLVICISRWTIGISLKTAPFQLAIIFGLAFLSYQYVENPLRRRVWFGRPIYTIATGLAVMISSAALILVANRLQVPAFSGVSKLVSATDIGIEPGYRSPMTHRLVDNCSMQKVWSEDAATLARRVADCSAGPKDSLINLIFMGDSHALDLFPTADAFAQSGIARVTNLYETSCSLPPPNNDEPRCQLSLKFVDALPDAHSFPSRRSFVVIRNNISPKAIDGSLSSFKKRMEPVVRSLVARGYAVVYFAPSPKYYSVGPDALCSIQWFRPASALSSRCAQGFTEMRSEQVARRSDFLGYLEELQRKVPQFVVFDPFETLCGSNATVCSPLRNGHLIYRDSSHLTERGSMLLYEPLRDAVLGRFDATALIRREPPPNASGSIRQSGHATGALRAHQRH